ncbi:uncharacterized protein LOC126328065 [Schistocerca gregaria]|uniref:uncharacterized protein LOC126328065 n=1 Tax=Schistocerca gregaria TaxID=7010 RepID=UPI00211E36E3|nr:uncharacterized protein LOC126328065 [Schistocerca gregaria]XP_049851925.1 uncharacterized protein LOC126328065 [Schistocerca gregaria]
MDVKKTEKDGRFTMFLKHFLAGTVAGWAQVLVGQPFDTVKVRLQTASEAKYSGSMDCVKKILVNEGIRGFYKGTTVPLIGIGACVSVQFVALSQSKDMFMRYNMRRAEERSEKPVVGLTLPQVTIAGIISGIANGPLSTIIEHIRIRLQVQSGQSVSPFKLMPQIVRTFGWRALWKGWNATYCREIPGFGFYILTYELAIRAATPKDKTVNDVGSAALLLCGSLSGLGMWLTCYPLDVVKSRIQSDSLDRATAEYKSTLDCWKKTFRAGGVRAFYKGFWACILRSMPVNGATFLAYELAIRMMGGREV